jgi:chromosome segregation ATPase
MDFEQILKRVEWLDEERRKDKLIISTLEDRIMKMEGNFPPVLQNVEEISTDISRIQSALTKFDQIESSVSQLRIDLTRSVEAVEKNRMERDREVEKVRMADIESMNASIVAIRKNQDVIPEIKKDLRAREEEEHRLVRMIAEVEKKLLESRRLDDEYRRSQKLMEENIRQDSKRILDMQGELSAMRKRIEEQRSKTDLGNESLRKIEMRQNELVNTESERKQSQTAFIERQSMIQVERDRVWREWQSRFEVIEKQAVNLDAQLQALDATQRAVRHAQESFDEITQRFERRINEITEMQRLVEDRFRQEWVSFKADDQKRWSNYMLSQDEQLRETTRQYEKFNDRLVTLEDNSQDLQDLMQQMIQTTQKRLQVLLRTAREMQDEFSESFENG